jgi:hypothetical protein
MYPMRRYYALILVPAAVSACAPARQSVMARQELAAEMSAAPLRIQPAAALQDTSLLANVARLIRTSPVLDPSLSLAREAVFVEEVRGLLRRLPDGEEYAESIESVDQAMEVLESLSEERIATIRLSSGQPGFPVGLRRWSYRKSKTIPWAPLRADTAVRRPAVMYQFRYRPPGARRDTVVDVPCADGCDVRLP